MVDRGRHHRIHSRIRHHSNTTLPGPGYVFSKLRNKLTVKTETADNDLARSLGTLAYCGWCLSPYVTLPTWTIAAKASHIRFGLKWLAGWATATAIAAYYRHQAESRI